MRNFITIGLIILIGSFSILNAQQLPQLNSFMYNQLIYNPASGGMYESDFNFNSSGRFQWSGISGAPVSNYSWADFRFRKNSMSAGIVFNYDQIGPTQSSNVAANYTYIVRLTNKWKFSVGLRAGVNTVIYNGSSIANVRDPNDPNAANTSITYPTFGTGFQFYTKRFYGGIGVPDLAAINNNPYAVDHSKNFFQKNRNYTLMTGYRFKISDGFSLYPNSKIYYFPTQPLRVDLSLLGEITDYFSVGGSISTFGLAAAMASVYLSGSIRFMYAYEFNVNSNITGANSLTTHEINLMFQLDNLFSKKSRTK
jgi:type IX secretion system PorP/SprF family membrane protein